MKKILKYSLLMMVALGMISLQGCEEERWGKSPNLNNNIGAVTLINVNPDKTFFNALNNLATEEVEFEIDVDGFEVTVVNSVDVEMIFTEKDATKDAEGKPADLTYDPVLVKTVNTFPSTVTFSATEAVEAIKTFKPDFTIDSLEVGDGFNLVFPIHTADGRRLTTALNSDLCNEQLQPSYGGCNVAWAIACPSDLAGDYVLELVSTNIDASDFTSPYDATITGVGPGIYDLSDGNLQLFGEDIALRFTEVCGQISVQTASVTYPTLVFFDSKSETGLDPATGVITFDLAGNSASCCGFAGIEYKFTATPK